MNINYVSPDRILTALTGNPSIARKRPDLIETIKFGNTKNTQSFGTELLSLQVPQAALYALTGNISKLKQIPVATLKKSIQSYTLLDLAIYGVNPSTRSKTVCYLFDQHIPYTHTLIRVNMVRTTSQCVLI